MIRESRSKICICGAEFHKNPRDSRVQWESRRYCSITCANQHKKAPTDVDDRFWKYVPDRVHNTCWEWMGSRDANGYGQLASASGHAPVKAHRLSWELHFGAIADGLGVLHACDNPPCVNPQHLMLGTQMANALDMSRKSRMNEASFLNLKPGTKGFHGAGPTSKGERNGARG